MVPKREVDVVRRAPVLKYWCGPRPASSSPSARECYVLADTYPISGLSEPLISEPGLLTKNMGTDARVD